VQVAVDTVERLRAYELGYRGAGGAPAVLMRLDTSLIERAMCAREKGVRPAGLGRLASYVLAPAEERSLATHVLERRRPMSATQRKCFGLL
jgi:hypothetical protein